MKGLLIAGLLVLVLLAGCSSSSRQQVGNKETSAMEAKEVNERRKQPESRQYTLPTLLGKRRQEVIEIMGEPDRTQTLGTGDIIKSDDQLMWVYENRPYQGLNIVLHFEPRVTPLKYHEHNMTPPLDKVQQVCCMWQGPNLLSMLSGSQTGPFVTPRQAVPREILEQKPSEYRLREEVVYYDNKPNTVSVLVVIWHLEGKTAMAHISQLNDSFCAEERKMNLVTGEYEYRKQLSAAGRDWQNRRVDEFSLYSGYVPFEVTMPRDIAEEYSNIVLLIGK